MLERLLNDASLPSLTNQEGKHGSSTLVLFGIASLFGAILTPRLAPCLAPFSALGLLQQVADPDTLHGAACPPQWLPALLAFDARPYHDDSPALGVAGDDSTALALVPPPPPSLPPPVSLFSCPPQWIPYILSFVSPLGSAVRARTGAESRVLVSATTDAVASAEVVLGLLASVGPLAYKSKQVLAAQFLADRKVKVSRLSRSRTALGALSATFVVVTLSAVPFELYALGAGDFGGFVVCALVVAATGAATGRGASRAALDEIDLRNSMLYGSRMPSARLWRLWAARQSQEEAIPAACVLPL